jgi:glycosyltransferase involved in cell wall biosynthesis
MYVLAGNREVGEKVPIPTVLSDNWNNFEDLTANVFYVSNIIRTILFFLYECKRKQFDLLFLNSIFSFQYTVLPLFLISETVILSVRGMLHPSALKQKKLKKKLYLFLFKIILLFRNIKFHVTDEVEKKYVENIFGNRYEIIILPNIPSLFKQQYVKKDVNSLNLITIALVSSMKNHYNVLLALMKCKSDICYRIYGPIKEYEYWENCKLLIQKLPLNVKVQYMGPISPNDVEQELKWAHVKILPSKSENYGHAMVEALSAGKPLISSHFIPWNDLNIYNAGFNVNPNNMEELVDAMEFYANVDATYYDILSSNASVYIRNKVNINQIKNAYIEFFKTIVTKPENK